MAGIKIPNKSRCFVVKYTGKYPYARCQFCEKRLRDCFGVQFTFIGFSIIALLLLTFTISDLPALVVDIVLIIFMLVLLLAIIANREANDMVISNFMMRKLNLELVHQIRHSTKEITEINNQLEKANRLKTEFLSNVSHELRTPLTSIMGFSDVLLEEKIACLNDDQRRFMRSIRRNSRGLLSLINNLLDSSKIEAGKMEFLFEYVDINNMIKMVTEDMKPLLDEKEISMVFNPIDIPHPYADKEKIKRVLINLLNNATKFTGKKGQITIDAAQVTDGVQISVSDTGVGIKSENLSKVFEKFTKASMLGTGLGLSIVKSLVEAHGGRIWAESQGAGQGSRFIFIIPLKKKEEE